MAASSDVLLSIITVNIKIKDIKIWVIFLVFSCCDLSFFSTFKKSIEKDVVRDVNAESALL